MDTQVNKKETAIKKYSVIKTSLLMIANPASAVNRHLEQVNWKATLVVPGSAFGLLFFQTALDLRQGSFGFLTIILTLVGILYGCVGVAGFAYISSAVARSKNSELGTTESVIVAFCLGYTATFIYQLVGLFFALVMNWNTSVAFGVSGMLIALRPMMTIIRKISDNAVVGVVLSTLGGIVLLLGWSLLGLIGR
jgi:hypothetical protein